jgi:hypothetical protein
MTIRMIAGSGVKAEGRARAASQHSRSPLRLQATCTIWSHHRGSLSFEACMKIEPKFGSRSCRRVERLLLGAPCPAYGARIRQEGQLQAVRLLSQL